MAVAQDAPRPSLTLEDVPISILGNLRRSMSVEEFSASIIQSFRQVAKADGVLTADDVTQTDAAEAAQRRARQITEMLAMDLDGDGAVTKTEVLQAQRSRQRDNDNVDATIIAAQLEKTTKKSMRADADGDGTITFVEMLAQATAKTQEPQRNQRTDRATAFMVFDADSDGSVTLAEIRVASRHLYSSVDLDGDEVISEPERRQLMEQFQAIAQRQQIRAILAACQLPKPQSTQQIIVLNAQRGREIPRVSVAGMTQTTWSGTVKIEPGAEPLWILATANDPMVWRFEGAVERVAQFVVVPEWRDDLPAAGVTGLTKEQVHFVMPAGCEMRGFVDKAGASPVLNEFLGRAPDRVVSARTFIAVGLPSGTVEAKLDQPLAAPEGVPEEIWQNVQRFGIGRIIEIAPADVIASTKAEIYDVLPEESGIIQLIQEGAIVPRLAASYIDVDLTTPGLTATKRRGYIYEIVKPIAHFPAGLAGAHSAVFSLGKGVPMPGGDPEHSCVLDGPTGKPLAGVMICKMLSYGP